MSTTHVRAPASTSNLGPGFDFLGLALDLWLEVSRAESDTGQHELICSDDESAHWPRHENLLLRAFDRALLEWAAAPQPSRFVVRSEIPLGRGLGSSGAAVAAGLLLGAAAAGDGQPDRARLLELGLALEGHPDNSSAALLGGCTLAVPIEDGGLKVVRQALDPALHFAVAWSSATLSTRDARRALPRDVPFADAVENPRRLALLLEGLRTGRRELIALGTQDRLHVAARSKLIEGAPAAMQAALAAGAFAATISGSGSALIAIHNDAEQTARIAQAMAAALQPGNDSVESRVLRAAHGGRLKLGTDRG